MDDLTHDLQQLCRRNRDGSHATQDDRKHSLTLAAQQLREAGFRQMRATSLKGKHVEALLARWQREGLAVGTIKNRLAHLRWWAEKIDKAGLLPKDNTQLGIADRRYVTNISKAVELGPELGRISDPHVRMSLNCRRHLGCGGRRRSSSGPAMPTGAIILCSRAPGPRVGASAASRSPHPNNASCSRQSTS